MTLDAGNIAKFYDNPLKKIGSETEHDSIESKHYDIEAERFLAENDKRALLVDFDEPLPPRHRAFWIAVGDVENLRVLDIGCGYGYAASRLALCGAKVTAIDVSEGMCDLTRRAAHINGVDIDVRKLSAVDTGLPEGSFDLIVGQVSLHHLPLDSAGPEFVRLLKPGGRAVFLEPIHPWRAILKMRAMLPISCQESPGGGALRADEIERLGIIFGEVELKRFAILERLRRFRSLRWASPFIFSIDNLLLAIPVLRGLAAHAVIELTKNQNPNIIRR